MESSKLEQGHTRGSRDEMQALKATLLQMELQLNELQQAREQDRMLRVRSAEREDRREEERPGGMAEGG